MEVDTLFSIICFSIPILIILGIIFLAVIFFIIRSILQKARRKVGIPKDAGKIIREQLANFDQYVQNDNRQTKQWQSSAPLNEPVLDLEDIEEDDIPPRSSTQKKSKRNDIAFPNWVNDSLTCEACGAPQELQHTSCPYCGHKHF
jgi:hypothetical protein